MQSKTGCSADYKGSRLVSDLDVQITVKDIFPSHISTAEIIKAALHRKQRSPQQLMLLCILAHTLSLQCLHMLPDVARATSTHQHTSPGTAHPSLHLHGLTLSLHSQTLLFFFSFCGLVRELRPPICWATLMGHLSPPRKGLSATTGHQSHTGIPVHQEFLCLKKAIYFWLSPICCKIICVSSTEGLTSPQ